MMFLYFVAEAVLVYFAFNKYDISEEVKQCKYEKDCTKIYSIVKNKRIVSIVFFTILLLLSLFQSIDWFRMCSPKTGFKTILNQNPDHLFPGLLCFANVVVAIASIVFIIKIVYELCTNGLKSILKERITKVGSFNSALSNLEKKYGKMSEMIRTNIDDTVLNNAIIRFDSSQHLFCLGQIIPYSEIKKCESYSIPIYKTTTKTITKTNSGSALGRAVVGGVVAGPVGAVIGGTTGKKESETVTEKVIERMEYKAVITLINGQTITIPIDSLAFDNNNNKTILTQSEIVKQIETIVNGAVDIHLGLLEVQTEMTELLDAKNNVKSFVCTMCGHKVNSFSHPSNCPICGNNTFEIDNSSHQSYNSTNS